MRIADSSGRERQAEPDGSDFNLFSGGISIKLQLNIPSFMLSTRRKKYAYQTAFLHMKIRIPIKFGAFNTLIKYSGYPFFHQPTFVLSG
jgi:hypothetical protein